MVQPVQESNSESGREHIRGMLSPRLNLQSKQGGCMPQTATKAKGKSFADQLLAEIIKVEKKLDKAKDEREIAELEEKLDHLNVLYERTRWSS